MARAIDIFLQERINNVFILYEFIYSGSVE